MSEKRKVHKMNLRDVAKITLSYKIVRLNRKLPIGSGISFYEILGLGIKEIRARAAYIRAEVIHFLNWILPFR